MRPSPFSRAGMQAAAARSRMLAASGTPSVTYVNPEPPPERPPAPAPTYHAAMTGRDPQDILHTVFGYESFRGQQADIVNHVVAGNDALVLMPTGGGKSLCYQVPALARKGVTVVVSPLIALMRDQVQALEQAGVRAGQMNSKVGWDEVQRIEQAMRKGEIDLVYVAPERFTQDRFRRLLEEVHRNGNLALFAIDEAHCVSQWGHDFRKDYLVVGDVCRQFPTVPRLALTATADPATEKDMIARLHLGDARVFRSSFDRPNIHYTVVEKTEPRKQLVQFLTPRKGQSGVVYCLSKKKVDDTAEYLRTRGFDAVPYHAGLSDETRANNQDYFVKGDGVIVVATIAFGMGIDKSDVRFVCHLDLPQSLEAYYQETGRAGRDGLPATAWMCYGLQDIVQRQQMIDGGEGNDAFKRIQRQRLQQMIGYVESADCRRGVVLRYFGEEHAGGCGRCDRCQNPVQTYDGTVDAQKLLSAAARTGERYGGGYLVDVVLGDRSNAKLKENGHTVLPTFGTGSDKPRDYWQSVLRQMVAGGFLTAPPDRHGGLVLTPEGQRVLKSERTVNLVRPQERTRIKLPAQPGAGRGMQLADGLPPERQELWSALKALRLELARAQSLPPYVIFHDATLMAMVAAMPASLEELGRVEGVGTSKLTRYGERFLAVIAEHRNAPALPDRIGVPGFFGR